MLRRIFILIIISLSLNWNLNTTNASLWDIPNLDYVEYTTPKSVYTDIDRFEDKIWISNLVSNSIEEFSIESNSLMHSVKVNERPNRFVVNGKYLWIKTTYSDVIIIDAETKNIVDTIKFPRSIVSIVSAGKFVWVLLDPHSFVMRPGADPFTPILSSSALIMKYDGASRKLIQTWCGLRYGLDNSACDADRQIIFPNTVGFSSNLPAAGLTANEQSAWVCSSWSVKESPIRKIDATSEKVVSSIMYPESCSKMWASENLLAVMSDCKIFFFSATTQVFLGLFEIPLIRNLCGYWIDLNFDDNSIYLMLADLLAREPGHFYELDSSNFLIKERISFPQLTEANFILIDGRIWAISNIPSEQGIATGKLFSFNTRTKREQILAASKSKAEAEARAKAEAEARAKAEAEARAKEEAEKASSTKKITNKKITITCKKGRVFVKVTAVKPKCPQGFIVKK